MSKGRPPKPDAVRRGGKKPDDGVIQAVVCDELHAPAPSVEKPDTVRINPTMSRIWDELVGSAPGFEQCDVPLLEAYCYWYAVFQNAMYSTMDLDGRVSTVVAKRGEDGEPDASTARQNPDLRTAREATDQMKKLADALNISPVARVRSGLMRAMTASTAADLAARTRAGAELFARERGRLDAPK